MDWILHIGFNKTGTTAIQQYLSHYFSTGLSSEVCYPISGRKSTDSHIFVGLELKYNKVQTLEEIIREGEKSLANTGVISYEYLYKLTSEQIELIYNTIKQAKIVLFIRRQDQLINSIYNEMIKDYTSVDIIRKFEKNINYYNPLYNYMLIIKQWAKIFGINNIIPIIYDKNESAIKQLFSHIGSNEILVSNEQQNGNPNPALSFEAAKILRIVKERNNNDNELRHVVSVAHNILRNRGIFVDTYNKGDQYLLSTSQRQAIYELYAESNNELRAIFFPERERLFPEFELSQENMSSKPVDERLLSMIFEEARNQPYTDLEVQLIKRDVELADLKCKLAQIYNSRYYKLASIVKRVYSKVKTKFTRKEVRK